jgi:hypothetical protein
MRRLFRDAATALFGVFMAIIVEPLIHVNVEDWAREHGYDKFLSWATSAVPDFSPWLETRWFWFAFGVSAGIALALWIVRLTPDRPLTQLQSTPIDRDEYRNEVVYINDLVRDGPPLLSGKTFRDCLIKGPAFLKFQNHCNMEFCNFSSNDAFTVVREGYPIRGAILVSRTTFRECYFAQGVALLGTAEDAAQMKPAMDVLPLSEWQQRHPITG